jgi:gluconokinase
MHDKGIARIRQSNRRVVVMGVSGSGKTTIGKRVGQALGIPYIDGDSYHPQANIDKMARGVALDDADRAGWLSRLTHLIRGYHAQGKPLLIGCSALKKKYRDQLREGDPHLIFLFLDGSFDVILARMQQRRHFFSAGLLTSQFKTLELPTADEVVVPIEVDQDLDYVVRQATTTLQDCFSMTSN